MRPSAPSRMRPRALADACVRAHRTEAGNLRFEDFAELMLTSRRVTSYEDEMMAVFRIFDKDDDGQIDADDIRETMKVRAACGGGGRRRCTCIKIVYT